VREGAYTLCSAPWYFDYFVANGFADCRVYVGISAGAKSNIYWLDPAFMTGEIPDRSPDLACWWRTPFVLAFAEKGERSTANAIPTQAPYRSNREWELFRKNLDPIMASQRPHLLRSIGHLFPRSRSRRSQGFVWIDEAYRPHPLRPWLTRPHTGLVVRAKALARSAARLVGVAR
jgi:hypothetical protein